MKRILILSVCFFVYSCSTYKHLREKLSFNDQSKEVILVDIDHTIADVSSVGFLVSHYEEIPQLPFSSSTLQELSKKYSILYLTARHEVFKEDTLKWLEFNRFPKGDVLFWNLADFPFFDSDYKFFRIESLKKQNLKIAFAIGDKDSDIEAYTKHKINTFIIRQPKPKIEIEGVSFVTSWREIRKNILKI